MTRKNDGDPTSRRRRSPDAMLRDAQEIVRRNGSGESIRDIARDMGLPRNSVWRVVQEYRRAQARAAKVDELDSETAALLAKYDGGMSCEDARTAEDIKRLNDLEYYRLRHLPMDHPARVAWHEAHATGWKRPEPELAATG